MDEMKSRVAVLLDAKAPIEERVRAAKLLRDAGAEAEPRVLAALVKVATDHDADAALGTAVGASIAALRMRRGIVDNEFLMDFSTAAFEGYDTEGARLLRPAK
jgi:hypothetical protein